MRCREFPFNGQVSAEWSRYPGSIWHGVLETMWLATKLSRLDAREDGKIVCWCTQAPRHSSQGMVRSTLLLNGPGLRWLFATLLLQHTNWSQQAVSRV